jgi:hypothetical protein
MTPRGGHFTNKHAAKEWCALHRLNRIPHGDAPLISGKPSIIVRFSGFGKFEQPANALFLHLDRN